MSTVVYQGLQSCLESQLMESRTLKLKLSSPKVVFSQSLEMALQSRVTIPADCDSKKLETPLSPTLDGWGSVQALPNPIAETPCEKLQAPYVHPSTKHYSSWWLSENSLNLCTENLGSETGSEFIENSIFSSPAVCSTIKNKIQEKRVQRQPRTRQAPEPKKEFPPPLTTLRGPDYLQVSPHREDGRLILKATRATTSKRCFQVDRSNGRLRLSFTDSSVNFCISKESVKDDDDDVRLMNEVTNKGDSKDGEVETNPEITSSSSMDDVERVEMKKMWDEQRAASSCCRCNESHDNNNNTKTKGMMTSSMVKLEPHFLVASS